MFAQMGLYLETRLLQDDFKQQNILWCLTSQAEPKESRLGGNLFCAQFLLSLYSFSSITLMGSYDEDNATLA